jgi:DNA-binding CsgD family transcriptional regulator
LSKRVSPADLIADIYDAAIDQERWPDFSKLVGKAAGIENMGVWLSEHDRIIDMSMVELWRPLVGAYKDHFSKMDPWARSLSRAAPGTIMLGYEHLREDELVKTEFYNDFARPGGMFRPMGVRLRLAPGVSATIGSDLPWAKKRFDQSDKPRLKRVLPHIKGALQLRLRRGRSAPRAQAQNSVIEGLAFGVAICDAACRIVFSNAAAESIIIAGAGITAGDGGRLGALVPAEARRLAVLIHDAASGGPGGVLRLTGKDRVTALLVLITPLPRSLQHAPEHGHALVALRPARDSLSFTDATLSALFALSPAQAAIARAIFNGQTPEEIACERGIRISTLRTHLTEIFLRTGAENQRDLVRLLGTLPQLRTG